MKYNRGKTLICVLVSICVYLTFIGMVYGQEKRYTVAGYPACFSRDDLDRLVKYMAQDDKAAVAQLEKDRRCFELKAGLPCYVMKTGFGVIEIRPEGKTATVWTLWEALKK